MDWEDGSGYALLITLILAVLGQQFAQVWSQSMQVAEPAAPKLIQTKITSASWAGKVFIMVNISTYINHINMC